MAEHEPTRESTSRTPAPKRSAAKERPVKSRKASEEKTASKEKSAGKEKTAGKKKSAGKERTAGKKKTARQKTAARKKLSVARASKGLAPGDLALPVDAPELAGLVREVVAHGGEPLGCYREPLSGRPILLAALPIKSVEPTPFQRDLSPTHTKRLAQKIEESGSFLDPIIVVRGEDGRLWTPNGRHRLASAKVIGLQAITALVSPDEDLAFRILALNTEKAHNLKDRSLEVIRMAQELARRKPRARELDFAAEFEAPELLTLGLVYLENGRFAGGAYSPFLKKVDRFESKTLPASLREREGYAARLVEIDGHVKRIVGELQARGFKSPYLRNYVVARINPVRFHRAKPGDAGPTMAMKAALTRMAASAKKFDVAGVRERDLALVAATVGSSEQP